MGTADSHQEAGHAHGCCGAVAEPTEAEFNSALAEATQELQVWGGTLLQRCLCTITATSIRSPLGKACLLSDLSSLMNLSGMEQARCALRALHAA